MPQQQLKHETKERRLHIALKAVSEDGNGSISGYANVIGVKDSWCEVTKPGAFVQDIAEFVGRGYLLLDHEWSYGEGVVGFIAEAKEDEHGLWFRAEFHSTPEAQRARKIVTERIQAKKEVGLSIGYWVLDGAWEMMDGEEVYGLKRILVKEVSIVVAQANAPSTVTGVKGTREDQYKALIREIDSYIASRSEIKEKFDRGEAWHTRTAKELLDLGAKCSELAAGLASEKPAAKDDDGDARAALALLEADLAISGAR